MGLLSVDHPQIFAQLSPRNNTNYTTITSGSSKKVWWECEHGHQWEAAVKNRTKKSSGCPYCSGRKTTAENSIAVKRPGVVKFFVDQTLPGKLAVNSRTLCDYHCEHGHTWRERPIDNNKTIDENLCPYCSHRKVLVGFNDIGTTHPDIATQWCHQKNSGSPQEYMAHQKQKVWWECEHGHQWETTVFSRCVLGSGCHACGWRQVVPGYNDLATTHPRLLVQWDYEKNDGVDPAALSHGSNVKVWWKCENGHSWEAMVSKRTSGTGCPRCAGNSLTVGVNDFTSQCPELLGSWDYEKNDILPSEVSQRNSTTKIWWTCDAGHSWEATPLKRNSCGCPYCANRKVLAGFNDLASRFPELMEEWDHERNVVSPEDIAYGSAQRVFWKCKNGHTWETQTYKRTTGNRTNCPKCSYPVSRAENELYEYVVSLLPDCDVIQSDRDTISPKELDIHIPGKNIAIEYNGLYWHSQTHGKDQWFHYNKWLACKDKGIQLITIWEDDWRDRQDVVKSMISHKLGASNLRKVHARDTTVVSLYAPTARLYSDKYHIQGFTQGSTYLALEDKTGEIVALSIWRKNKNTLYLDRYCTSARVVGGMGKLLKQGISYAKEHGCTEIITFADHQVSDGGLYGKLGFVKDRELKPDYSYVVDNTRRHKFGFRINTFRDRDDLRYAPGLTESELAELNDIKTVWDCGKTRFTYPI